MKRDIGKMCLRFYSNHRVEKLDLVVSAAVKSSTEVTKFFIQIKHQN